MSNLILSPSPSKNADFVTTMRHLFTITDNLDQIADLGNISGEAMDISFVIEQKLRKHETPTREDLERAANVCDQYQDITARLNSKVDDIGLSAYLLLGRWLREPGGDLAPPEEASARAQSEAIV